MNPQIFIKELYHSAVDTKDLNALSSFLAENVLFRLANFDAVKGREEVLEANKSFFNSIKSMNHVLDDIWSIGTDIICKGSVQYIRLDGSFHTANFSTFLKLEQEKISEYIVYADLSDL